VYIPAPIDAPTNESDAGSSSSGKSANAAGAGTSASGAASSSAAGALNFETYFADGPLDLDARCSIIEQRLEPFYGDTIDTILVSGNTHTKRKTITREMATKEGDELDRDLIVRDATYLRGLGFFSDVDISAARISSGRIQVQVSVIERPALFMRFPYPIVNYHLERGVTFGFRWRIKNFRGQGENLLFYVNKRRDREHEGALEWSTPWVGERRIAIGLGIYNYRVLREPEDDFIKERNGGKASVSLPLTSSLIRRIYLTPMVSFEQRQSNIVPAWIDPGAARRLYLQNILTLGLGFSYDSRNSYIAPTSGWNAGVGAARATAVYGLEQEYMFYSTYSYLYVPMPWIGTMIVAFDGLYRDGDLYEFYAFGMGGNDDLRGYEGSVERGRTRLISNLQLRRRFFGPTILDLPLIGKFDLSVNAIAFVDHGALADRPVDLTGARYLTTGGFGVEIISPIQDVVRIELAFGPDGNPMVYMTGGARF
jgi:outer membrane protein assembly factor BamA